jgi:hypothetical protein
VRLATELIDELYRRTMRAAASVGRAAGRPREPYRALGSPTD